MVFNGFIQVRCHTLMLKSLLESASKVAERARSSGMTRRTEFKRCTMEVNGLIHVRHDALLMEPVSETDGKVIESHGSIRMTRRTLMKGSSQMLNIVCHRIVAKMNCKSHRMRRVEWRENAKFKFRASASSRLMSIELLEIWVNTHIVRSRTSFRRKLCEL